MNIEKEDYKKVLSFWFEDLTPEQWYFDKILDDGIKERFCSVYWAIVAGETEGEWRTHAQGAFTEIIVLDQFARSTSSLAGGTRI